MASTDNEVPQPIIIKKVKKGGHGHHGGAWKVAYADFVTAMMAFFLLMWLLNVTTEDQKNAISHYFDPTHPRVSSELSGSGGILGGMTMSPDGAQVSNVQSIAPPSQPNTPRSGMAKGNEQSQYGSSEFEGDTFDTTMEGTVPSDTDRSSQGEDGNDLQDGLNILDEIGELEQEQIAQLQGIIEEQQNADYEAIKQQILEEVSKAPELADLLDHLMVDVTPEGLRIQIIDNEGRSMFPIGSAQMYGFMKNLVAKVTQVILPQPNQISVRGHTDGKPYPDGAIYNNWNLSSDRALASRKAMIEAELPATRVENVIGKADREHLFPDEPLSPRNRRISIVLLRESYENTNEIRQAAAVAIEKRQQAIEAQRALEADRQNIPELDRVIRQPRTRLENTNDSPLSGAVDRFDVPLNAAEENETGNMVGDEIQRMQRRNQQQRMAPQLTSPPRSPSDEIPEPQVLEF